MGELHQTDLANWLAIQPQTRNTVRFSQYCYQEHSHAKKWE
jgi:hypothetical protein